MTGREPAPVRTIRLDLAYDGTGFHGWARQPGARTVETVLREALDTVFGEVDALAVAGRTDAGVHALAQAAHVDLARERRPDVVRDAVNAHLGAHPVSITRAEVVGPDFEARFSATKRHYLYRILNRRARPAVERGRVWWAPKKLDAEAMHSAAQQLVDEPVELRQQHLRVWLWFPHHRRR